MIKNVWDILSRGRLEYKILIVLALGLTFGFGSYVIYSIQSETEALLVQHRQKSRLFAESVKSGIRNMMLSGRPSYVRTLIEEMREEFRTVGSVRIFNNESKEIFPDERKFITRVANDSLVNSFVKGHAETINDDRNYLILKNEKLCQTCHGTNHSIRGLMRMSFTEEHINNKDMTVYIVAEAFKSIMLSGKGEAADDLLKRLDILKGVREAQVYDGEGIYVAFGNDETEFSESILEEVSSQFRNGEKNIIIKKKNNYSDYFLSLKNEENCNVCHGSDHSIRGILALSLDNESEELLPFSAAEGFKSLMVIQKGSYTAEYVDKVRQIPFVESFEIFDNGKKHQEEIHELFVRNPNFNQSSVDDSVTQLITAVNKEDITYQKVEYNETLDNGERVITQIFPLLNDEKCQACHKPPQHGDPTYDLYGDRWKVRCAVKVSTSMEDVIKEINRNVYASVGLGLVTIIVMGILLRIFMKILVVRPLLTIGDTAEQVGVGDLSVEAVIQSKDEIGALAERINNMIFGLRERLHLTKFVSGGTVDAVKEADLSGVALGGERRNAVVFFSDIRGFTSYSEKVEPEQVINMLNTYLNEQAVIVKKHNGDIDKFVGDELMAVFKGEKMIEHAIESAIEIQKTMNRLREETGDLIHVGIGINAGPVVMGAMGSKERMDYTVLGDNVNLAARLCNKAGPDEIIISQKAIGLINDDHSFRLMNLKPISVKGKKEPIAIFKVDFDDRQ